MTVVDSGDRQAQRIRVRDAVLPGLLAVVGGAEILAGSYHPAWLVLATYGLACCVLCARRAAPLAMPPVVAGIYALTPVLGYDVSEPVAWLLLIPFACFSAGLHAGRSRRYAGLACVLAALAITLAGLLWLTDFEPNVLFGLIFSVGPWGLGVALQEALERHRRAAVDAEFARVERTQAAERAAAQERGRIADELHDALAHALGAMVVQATVANDLVRRDAGAATAALHDLAQTGREALSETGRLLRLIRDDGDELGLQAGEKVAEADVHAPAARPAAGPEPVERTHLLLPAVFGVIGTVEILWESYEPLWGALAAYWLAVAVLCVRHALPLAMPLAVTSIAVGASLVGIETDDPAAWILPLALAFLAAGLHGPRPWGRAGLAGVLAGIALLAVNGVTRTGALWDALFPAALAVGAVAFGISLRQTLERNQQLAAATARERLEGELEAERGAAAERRRIARELHDVLANSLSVMIVQAALAADLVATDPEAASSGVAEVQRSGRTALRETGRLLALIDDGPGTHPQLGMADLRGLAEEYERAGLAIELDLEDGAAPLPIGVELSSYRIVQEGLTNALKHAPGSRVHIRFSRRGSDVAIEVRNGRAVSATLARVSGGHGLVGLRERVSLFGGDLDAGPTPDGGYSLAATLPVDAETA